VVSTRFIKTALFVVILFGVAVLFIAIQTIKRNENERNTAQIFTVVITDSRFDPAVVYVNFGDIILWKNEGLRVHSVTFESLSKILIPGESWPLEINEGLFEKGESPYWDDASGSQQLTGKLIIR
jgi:plastocyanin